MVCVVLCGMQRLQTKTFYRIIQEHAEEKDHKITTRRAVPFAEEDLGQRVTGEVLLLHVPRSADRPERFTGAVQEHRL